MLQQLRDNSKGVISGILIGFLVIIFAVMGSEGITKFVNADNGKVVVVNGEGITETEIARGIAMRKQQIISRYGESVPAEYLTDEKLRAPVIEGLVQRSVLTQAAKKTGLTANTENIYKEIATLPQFQKEGGAFDNERYTQMLRNMGYTPATYLKIMGEDAVVNQLQSGIVTSAFVTPSELKNIIGLSFQTRDFSYVIFPAEKAEKAITISDADLKANYDANPQTYTTPEQVAVDYVELSTAELMKAVKVTDEQIQKQFEQNTKAFVAKTERQAAHILLTSGDQKRADEVKAKLAAGEDFAKLAKEFSTDAGSKDQGGDLGFTSGDAFPSAFESALAKLKVGEVSAPVKTDAGIHIIKLVSERGGKAPTLEEAKAGIIDQLKRAEAETQYTSKLEKLRDLSYNADKLADVAKELGLTLQNSGLFGKTGGKDLTANNLFVNAAFSPDVLDKGNSSDVIEIEPNRVLVLKKTDRKPAQLQPLDSVKDQVTKAVRADKTQALLAQQAKEFTAALNAGKSIAEQAKAAGLEVKTATNATRSDKDADREVLQFVFGLATPAADKPHVGATKTGKGDYAVVSLTAVHLGTEDKVPAEQKTSINMQLGNIFGENDFKSYEGHLEEVAKIKRK